MNPSRQNKLRKLRNEITNPTPKASKGKYPWVVTDYRCGLRRRHFFETLEAAQRQCDRITEHYQVMASMRADKLGFLEMVGGWGLLNEILCHKYGTNLCDVAMDYMRQRQRAVPLTDQQRNLFSMLAAVPQIPVRA